MLQLKLDAKRRCTEMDHASFIIGSWVLTAVSVGAYAGWIVKRGRELARRHNEQDLPWT